MNSVIKRKSPYAVVSLTLGIISIFTALFWYISIPTGVLAIIFGNYGKKTVGSKIATAGKIVGIVGVSISGFILIAFLSIYVISNIASIF